MSEILYPVRFDRTRKDRRNKRQRERRRKRRAEHLARLDRFNLIWVCEPDIMFYCVGSEPGANDNGKMTSRKK